MVQYNPSIHIVRYRIQIYGIVQGVGFRPFVYQKALEYQIKGWVKNSGGAVVIACSGTKESMKKFIESIINNPPKLARVEKVKCRVYHNNQKVRNWVKIKDIKIQHVIQKELIRYGKGVKNKKFVIKKSTKDQNFLRFISPDISTCPKCLEDISNKNSNYYRYAFTNCTECGPRYSIIKELPYDRHATTMYSFPMCEDCQKEYDAPLSRRFHTQSTCCKKCGPILSILDSKGRQVLCKDPIKKANELLINGNIIAIKGIGGFHLVCNGKDEKAIYLLRKRKNRMDKPLALMAKNIDIVKEICYVSEKEEEILTSNKRPIVLLEKKPKVYLPEIIAPKRNKLGIMLPYTPLQYLLLENQLEILIMTSGNISSLPIEYMNENIMKHLNKIADYFLIHNRDIHMPIDDSVVKVVNGDEIVTRIARGYAPYSVQVDTKEEIIAVGGQQKNTVCISKGGYAYVSPYIGDLEEVDCYDNFQKVLNHFCTLFSMNGNIYAHDIHPIYLSTKYALLQYGRKIPVQHHHAHMVSCMAEHSLYDTVIGVVFDGTGYGLDGAVWGGEFFVGNRCTFRRVGHLEYVMIQGGNQAIKEPWRSAVSYIQASGYDPEKILRCVDIDKIEAVKHALMGNVNCFQSSSMGRLFDAIAAMIGLSNTITYDGQAAIELENIMKETGKETGNETGKETGNETGKETGNETGKETRKETGNETEKETGKETGKEIEKETGREIDMETDIEMTTNMKTETELPFVQLLEEGDTFCIPYKPIIDDVITDILRKEMPSNIAVKFHNSIINATCNLVCKVRDNSKINKVVLSGGVYENQYLLQKINTILLNKGFQVYYHKQIPTNDSGISFGQLHVATAIINKESETT